MQYIKIHALDNVAVALADLAEGTEVSVDNQTVTLRQDVARGHKFALTDIAKGANVIKYGLPIGYALADIAAGEHVHAHNTRTNLSDLDQYRYQPDFQDLPAQAADREVQIYRRANGDVGVRNELWILPTVGCVNGIARQIQNRFLKRPTTLKVPTACSSSATPTAAHNWATITSIPAPCCKTWCATQTRAQCW